MRYKVTNESASTKVLPSVAPGMNVFFKPGESREVDLRQLTSSQIKKFATAKLYVEEVGLADLIAAATVEAAVTQPTPAVTEPTPAPAAPPPSKPAPAAKAPSAAPTEGAPPAPEPWQKGLEPPK